MNFEWENIFKKAAKENDTLNILSKNMVFEELNKKELSFVENLVHTRNFRGGEHIFRQGEVGVGMYIVVNGYVDILVDDSSIEMNKGSLYVTRLEAGDFFGEIALIEENGRRTANAIAHSEVTLLGFFKPDLNELVERNPVSGVKVISRLAQVLGRRLRETSKKITELKREIEKV